MKTIEIVVDPRGEAVLQTKGFTGPACRDASKLLERRWASCCRTGRRPRCTSHCCRSPTAPAAGAMSPRPARSPARSIPFVPSVHEQEEVTMSLSERLAELVRAAFTGIYVQSHEHEDAHAEIAASAPRPGLVAGQLGR